VAYDELDIPVAGPRSAPPLSYRRQREANHDGLRRLLVIVGGVAAALLLVIAAFSLGGSRSGSGQVPVVQADPRPVRVRPADPGGMQIAGLDDDLTTGDGHSDTLAAPDETPNPAALRAQSLSEARAEAQRQAALAPPPPVVAPTAPAAPPAATLVQPAPKQATQVALPADAGQPTPASLATAAPGRIEVQLAALTSEAAAQAEWKRLAARAPGLLNGHQPDISRTSHDDHVFWRLRTGGFADVAAATKFCVQVRAAGAVCSLANF